MCRSSEVVSTGKERTRATSRLHGTRRVKWVQTDDDSESEDDTLEGSRICKVVSSKTRPITVQLSINSTPLIMEVDTGVAVSIMCEQTQRKFFPNASLHWSKVKLRTYTDETMPVLGEMAVDVSTDALTLYVVQGNGPGRSWLQHIRMDWKSLGIATMQKMPPQLDEIRKYAAVFEDGYSTFVQGFPTPPRQCCATVSSA